MADLASEYLILWASQTGNAEWIAKNIHTEAGKKGYKGECFVMDEFAVAPLQKAGVIIMVSSNTGDGDSPDNSLKFWRFLRRNKDKSYFSNTRFTILGLGDSNYSNFNNSGKKLEKKFKDLGGQVFYEKGLADDAEGLENVVDPWIEKLWEVLPTVLKQEGNESIESSIAHEKELEKEMSELAIDPVDVPYSMRNRKKDLPDLAEKYTNLENTLVDNFTMEARREKLPGKVADYTNLENTLVDDIKRTFKSGFPLTISLAGLEAGAKLTGLPRVSVPVAKVTKLEGQKAEDFSGKVPDFVSTPVPITYAPVTMVSCLTAPDAVKRTLEVELDVGEDNHFEPGDAFGVLAPNDEELVEAILNRLNIPEEEFHHLYKVEGENLPTHLQKATSASLIELFRYAVDLTSHPRKALFRMLADHTTDPKEKLTLMYICSKQGAAAFNAIRDETPTLLDILETFPSCHPPIDRLLDLLPAHMPRFYSISSSPLKRQGKIRFAFNVVEYITAGKAERKGVATPWMDKITKLIPSRSTPTNVEVAVKEDIKVPMYIRQNANAFVLPQETERPLVLIGPGTGIAPFIGFLEHRQTQRNIRLSMGGIGHQPTQQIRDQFGPIYVYYGFRDKNKDFLFEKEIREFEKDGTISLLRIAESRAADGPKVYVQDLIKEDSSKLYDLIVNKDAAIYICGDAKGMAKGVQDALAEMLAEHEKIDLLEANKTLVNWISSKKYLRDLWA
ncbi:methionine synthase reductase [Mucor ambiguus]|uniref:Methionine synthase reductase n=1 Tax=Mucor ambiguus TaxID=91626 RepID=A0A0C9MK27_9FUNG|nr:methionine synthase reductase [Mucor ambiguus]